MPTPLPAPLARRPLLVVALLMAALLAALPAVASAQPLPPRLLWGNNDDVTVGGAPWDGSPIDLIDETGVVVATVDRDVESWSVRISNDVTAFRFRGSNGGVSQIYRIDKSVTQQIFMLVIGSPSGEDPVRQVDLLARFNFVVWTGHTQPVADALETFPDTSQLSAIFEYQGGSRPWKSYRPGLPAIVQSIDELRSGVAYFLLLKSAVTWGMPSDGDLPGTRTIAAGFTTIGWVAPDATPEDVLDAIANPAAVTAFFRYNAATQSYESYRPHLPPIARGSIRAIAPFDVLFMHAASATTITQ